MPRDGMGDHILSPGDIGPTTAEVAAAVVAHIDDRILPAVEWTGLDFERKDPEFIRFDVEKVHLGGPRVVTGEETAWVFRADFRLHRVGEDHERALVAD